MSCFGQVGNRLQGAITCAALGANENLLATATDSGSVSIWNTGLQEAFEVESFKHKGTASSVAFDKEQTHVLVAFRDGSASLWNIENGNKTSVNSARSSPDSLSKAVFWPHGETLFATGSVGGVVRVWQSDSDSPIQTFRSESAVTSMSFNPEGKWILVGYDNGLIKVWDVLRGCVAHQRTFDDAAITCVAFHPSDALVSIGNANGCVTLFDIDCETLAFTRVGQAIKCFGDGSNSIASAQFLPHKNELVALSSEGGVAKIQFDDNLCLLVASVAAPAFANVMASSADAGAAHDGTMRIVAKSNDVAQIWRLSSDQIHKDAKLGVVLKTKKKTKNKATVEKSAQQGKENASPARAPAADARLFKLTSLLDTQADVGAAMNERLMNLKVANSMLQQSDARLGRALQQFGVKDGAQLVAPMQQLYNKAQDAIDQRQYMAAFLLARPALAMCADILSNSANETQVRITLETILLFAEWVDLRLHGVAELEKATGKCRALMLALAKQLKAPNCFKCNETTNPKLQALIGEVETALERF